jgi:hypothetical protein
MSALDNIIKRAKHGSSGSTPSRLLSSNKGKKIEDDDDYKTIVDRPSSTYALTPYKSTKSIPSTYTNDFERIYQVVKSSYNCGQVQYNYGTCYYDNLVQNYVQKGEAIVSSMQGYSNVSLQDLPLACNIPSVVYNNCSPSTNMLTTEVTQTTAGFRLNMNGRYLYPKDTTNTELTFIDRNSLQIDRATFVLEKKSIDELNRLITQDKPYYEKYLQYKDDYADQYNNGFFLNHFYYIKHVSGKYLVPSYSVKYTRASIINFTYISQPSSYVIRIYDQNLDEIFSYDFDTNTYFNRTGIQDSKIIITDENSQGYVDIEFYDTTINIGDIKISAKNSPNNFYSFSLRLFSRFNQIILNTNSVVTTIQNSINSLPSSLQFQDIGVTLGELNPYYSKIVGEYYMGNKFEDSNTYPILFPFETTKIYMLTNNNANLSLNILRVSKYWDKSYFLPTGKKIQGLIANTIPFFIEKHNFNFNFNISIEFSNSNLNFSRNLFKLLSSNDTKNIIIYTHNFDVNGTSPTNWFYLSTNFGSTFSTITLGKNIQIIDLTKDGKYAIIAFTDNSVISYNLTNLNITDLVTFNYDNATVKPYSICQSYDGNVMYLCFDNKKLWVCFNRKVWKELSDIPYTLYKHYWYYYHKNTNFMDTNQTGKNIIYKAKEANNSSLTGSELMISRNYGSTFNMIRPPWENIIDTKDINIKSCDDEFYIGVKNMLYKLDTNNKFQLIFTDVSSENSYVYVMNITNTYVYFFVYNYWTEINSTYLLNKKSNNLSKINLYLPNVFMDIMSSYFINEKLSSIIFLSNKILKINTNIPQSMQDTPYVLNNGLCYPSYSFTTSTISNQGVKNVFNANTYVLSSETTIIKNFSNNLSITSSSILKNNTPIYTISGSIRDIACSNNGQYILAAVYNRKLLVSTNSGTSFTEYNEAGNLSGNTSSTSITDITRYWISVACSYSGKYMSACAYNGNIFISTNYGVLFTSSPENFAKKWVQIVMSKSSDDTKDGIIQLACAEDGLFISYDRGANWAQIRNEVIDSALGTNLKWSSIAISDSGQYMLATVYGGNVYASYNYGYDWSIYGVSRKECYEPAVYPDNQLSADYLDYNVSASSTLSGTTNIINAFKDDTSIWSPTTTDTNRNVTIKLPYKFLLTDINIVNLKSEDVKISVSGSDDGTIWSTPLGENLNLYSTVDNNGVSYRWFRLRFSTSNIEIQRIKLLGMTDFVSGGIMSQIGNWSSCAISPDGFVHYAGSDTGLNMSYLSSSFGKNVKIHSSSNLNCEIYDKNNNLISIPPTINNVENPSYTNSVKTYILNGNVNIGRINFLSSIPSGTFVTIEDDTGFECYRSDIVSTSNIYPPLGSKSISKIVPNSLVYSTTITPVINNSYINRFGSESDNNFETFWEPTRWEGNKTNEDNPIRRVLWIQSNFTKSVIVNYVRIKASRFSNLKIYNNIEENTGNLLLEFSKEHSSLVNTILYFNNKVITNTIKFVFTYPNDWDRWNIAKIYEIELYGQN